MNTERELLEMRRRRCVRDMGELQKEIDEIDRQIDSIELQGEPLVSRELVTGLERIEQAVDRLNG